MIVPKHRELAEEARAEVTAVAKAVVATEIAKEAVEVVVIVVIAVEAAVETVVVVENAVEMAKVAAEVAVNAVEAAVETVMVLVAVAVVAVDAPELLLMRRVRLSNRKAAVVVDLAVIDSMEKHAKMLTLWIDKTELDVAVVVIVRQVAVVATGEAISRLVLTLMTSKKIKRKPKILPQPSKRRSSKLPPSRKAKRKKATLSMISLPKSLPNRLVF